MGKHDAEHVKHNRNTPRSTKKTLISLHEEETPIIKKRTKPHRYSEEYSTQK